VTLENLLRIGQLKEHPPDAGEIQRLLAAARRNLSDAGVTAISPETRFDAAYKAIMQASLAVMIAHGFRPDTSRPGQHQTLLQALTLTIGLAAPRVTVLDTLRRKRNLSDYTGEEIDESTASACAMEAHRLLNDVTAWLKANRPGLSDSP
jgi:hypothetical protein